MLCYQVANNCFSNGSFISVLQASTGLEFEVGHPFIALFSQVLDLSNVEDYIIALVLVPLRLPLPSLQGLWVGGGQLRHWINACDKRLTHHVSESAYSEMKKNESTINFRIFG